MSLGFCLHLNPLQHTECPEGQRTWNTIKWRLIFRPDTSCSLLQERHFRDSQKKKRSVGSMEKFVNITQGKGHRTIYQFRFCCSVRVQMCRTDNTFSLWLMRPAHSESQICKARGIHPQMWNSLPENKLPKNWLAPTKLCTSWFSDQTNQLTTSLATGFSSGQDGKQSSK